MSNKELVIRNFFLIIVSRTILLWKHRNSFELRFVKHRKAAIVLVLVTDWEYAVPLTF